MKAFALVLCIAMTGQAFATSPAFPTAGRLVQRGEVCELLTVDKDEFKGGIAGIYESKQLAIIGERPFYANTPRDPQSPKPVYPEVLTKVVFTTGGEDTIPEVSLYETLQSTQFVDLGGKPIEDINNHEGAMFALYTHVYKDVVKDQKDVTLTVQHFQHVDGDHWKSYKAVASFQYKNLKKLPDHIPAPSANQVYTFKCSGYEDVNER